MKHLYYPPARLWPDYLRAIAGGGVCFGLVLLTTPQSVIFVLLTGLGLLFAWFGAHTLWRQQIEIELDPSGIVQRNRWLPGRRRTIPWADITEVRLRYYSTRRDQSGGWMLLTIKGRGEKVRVDSKLNGFSSLVRPALAAADSLGIATDAATRINAARMDVVTAGREAWQ